MKKILIIYFYKERVERGKEISRLLQERLKDEVIIDSFYEYDNEVEIKYLKEDSAPTFYINGKDIKEYSTVLIYKKTTKEQDLTSLIGQYCKYNNINIINTVNLFYYSAGKILQKLLLPLNGIKVPRYYFNTHMNKLSYGFIKDKLGEKFVAKQSRSKLGEKVLLIKSDEEFNEFLNDNEHNKDNAGFWFFEEFIPHSFTQRGFVTGDKCNVQITVSIEEGTFKTNHGDAVFSTNVEKDLSQIAIKAAQVMKLEISGVDTVINEETKERLVFEVNNTPGITIEPFVSPEIDNMANLLKNL